MPSGKEFLDLAEEVARLVDINDLFPDYLHRPLSARLRRDSQLATSLADLVPSLSDRATGIAVRLLSLSGRINRELVKYLRSQLESASEQLSSPTIDPLTGKVRTTKILFLDVLDTLTNA